MKIAPPSPALSAATSSVEQLLALQRPGLGDELEIIDHPPAAAVPLPRAAGRVHDAVERHETGVDQVTHLKCLLVVIIGELPGPR
jgi:hypothetical protein